MIKIQKNVLIAFLALIIFFEPTYISILPHEGILYNILKLITALFIFIYFIKRKKTLSISQILVLVGELVVLIFTILNNGQIESEFLNFIMLGTLVLLIELYSDDFISLLEALMLHFELCIYINLGSLILFPERLFSRSNVAYGATYEWFLGSRNSFINWLLPGLIIALIYRFYKRKSKRWLCLVVGILVTQLFQTSSTLIVSSAIILCLAVIPYFNRVFRPTISFCVSMVIQFVIVILNNVKFLAPIVEGILGKNLTFTNRTTIWKNAINHISIFRGYGKLQSTQVAEILGNFGNYIWKGATHAHNQLLNLGFQGGVILVVITLIIYYIAFWKLEHFWNNPIARVYSFGLFAYIIAGYTEVTNHLLLQLIVILPLVIEKTIIPVDDNIQFKRIFLNDKL